MPRARPPRIKTNRGVQIGEDHSLSRQSRIDLETHSLDAVLFRRGKQHAPVARTEIDDLFDGFVYGAVIGLGFAAVENVQYFIQAVAAAGGGKAHGFLGCAHQSAGLVLALSFSLLASAGLGLSELVPAVRALPWPRRLAWAYLLGIAGLAGTLYALSHFFDVPLRRPAILGTAAVLTLAGLAATAGIGWAAWRGRIPRWETPQEDLTGLWRQATGALCLLAFFAILWQGLPAILVSGAVSHEALRGGTNAAEPGLP